MLVRNGTDVLYSQLHEAAASINPPASSALFTVVDNGIKVAGPINPNDVYQLFVGFDDGAKPAKPSKKKPK